MYLIGPEMIAFLRPPFGIDGRFSADDAGNVSSIANRKTCTPPECLGSSVWPHATRTGKPDALTQPKRNFVLVDLLA
jgi:hypothetical protein